MTNDEIMEDLVKNYKKPTKSSVIFWYLGFFFVTLRHRTKQQNNKIIIQKVSIR